MAPPDNDSAEAREFQRIIRASVRECYDTWRFQIETGAVTAEALELLVARAAVQILGLLGDRPLEVALALLPSLVCTMLQAFLEVLTQQNSG
jgi:hypothetical protein